MGRHKLHISSWATLFLAAVVVLGCALTAVGISYARYRSDHSFERIFLARESGNIYLGRMDEDWFVQEQSTWETAGEMASLSFAVSNGTEADNWSPVDQQIAVRVLAGPGSWDDALALTVDGSTYLAVAEAIPEGSALYRSFGEGWILRFLNETGQEVTWQLNGDAWNSIAMQLSMSAASQDISLIRLQITAEAD